MDLSETLRDAIGRDGRSLYRLALDSKISKGTLVRFANKKRELTLPTASKLAAVLGLELVRRQARVREKNETARGTAQCGRDARNK